MITRSSRVPIMEERSSMVSETLRPARLPNIQDALAAVREIMDVEVACTTCITTSGEQVIEDVHGAGAEMGVVPAASFDFELTFCRRVLAGVMPALVGDVDEHPKGAA